MNTRNKNNNVSTYFVVFIIIIFALLLVYYALTAKITNKMSVGITGWTLTNISKAVYPINVINVSSVFDNSTNELYLNVKLTNGGNSTIGYLSGCESAFSGNVYPESIANLTYEKNIVSCDAISIAKLLPNQTVELSWPYLPESINVLQPGNFYANITFPFGFYSLTKVYCPIANNSCPVNIYKFSGSTENATIQVSLSSVN